MFQPRVKLNFVRHICLPSDGWEVFVDIDASEEGRTGGLRKSVEAKNRQAAMKKDAEHVRGSFKQLGVHVGQRTKIWSKIFGSRLPNIRGDRDVIAVHEEDRKVIIAEVEGESSGQPEQKVYKAIGQIVAAKKECVLEGINTRFIVVVTPKLRTHLLRTSVLSTLKIEGVMIGNDGTHEYVY